MAPRARLSVGAVRLIRNALDRLFDSVKARVIGDKHPQGKQLYIKYDPDLTLKGIFDASAQEEGVVPHADVFKALAQISGSYLDAIREKTKAKTVKAVNDFLHDASLKGIPTNVQTVLA